MPDSLDASLVALVDLLREHGEDGWATRLEQQRRLVAAHDATGLDRLLSLFGGMGSLTDLVIHPMNGHAVPDTEVDDVNQRLSALVADVASRARALRHAVRRSR